MSSLPQNNQNPSRRESEVEREKGFQELKEFYRTIHTRNPKTETECQIAQSFKAAQESRGWK